MIKAENISFSFPEKELYKKISFTLEDRQHCAFIGSNGTGKSTLVEMIMDPEKYLFDGKLMIDPECRIGYMSQFTKHDKENHQTVFEYLSVPFVKIQKEIADICDKMGTAEDLEPLMEQYQILLDQSDALDADNYEVNIKKQLKVAELVRIENLPLTNLSGGEYKLIQVIKEMLFRPDLMIMDEPDVFLDFENLNSLRDLINSYDGTMLVITHNRYLLNHCFNKILHLENADIQEFDGNYVDYNFTLLQKKIELQELAAADLEEIERNRKVVNRMRAEATKIDSATKGRTLHARVSLLERLEARRIKEPFVEIRQPEIKLPQLQSETDAETETVTVTVKTALTVTDYALSFEEKLLEHVSFSLQSNEKVAIVGANGTGKTTLLNEIYKNQNPAIWVNPEMELAFLSQFQGEGLDENNTVFQEFEPLGFERVEDCAAYLKEYCFEKERIQDKIGEMSGGEKNLLQLAKIGAGHGEFLLLDEPTSHLDTYAQIALEQAVHAYQGAILMVSHDFYTIANCMDYVLFVEDKTIRKMSIRAFRKMIYANHFNKDYLELEQKKKQVETKVARALEASEYEKAKTISEELAEIIDKMS